jgi:hypothetical protein
VVAGGLLAYDEGVRDLGVGHAAGDQVEDLALAGGEVAVDALAGSECAAALAHDRGCPVRAAQVAELAERAVSCSGLV